MGTADLHIHTVRSDGLPTVPELLDYVERFTDLDLIAITDHDEFRAAAEAVEFAARRSYRFHVVPGMEVTTASGHLLALFLEGPVPPFKSLDETIALVRERGGLCIVPHPFSWLTFSISQRGLQRLLAQADGSRSAGIEVANPSLAARITATRASAWSRRYGLAQTGGSDAHFLGDVGDRKSVV
jgi:predicted metal-dependent phosphoesterase TrpH